VSQLSLHTHTHTGGCIQKFPDWPLVVRTAMVQLSATRCSCIAILWVSLVSFAARTLCFASQRVFIVVISLSTQSRNFRTYPRVCVCVKYYIVPHAESLLPWKNLFLWLILHNTRSLAVTQSLETSCYENQKRIWKGEVFYNYMPNICLLWQRKLQVTDS
jgi:hypothetical protein